MNLDYHIFRTQSVDVGEELTLGPVVFKIKKIGKLWKTYIRWLLWGGNIWWKHIISYNIYMGVSGNVGDTVQSAQVADARQDLG